MIGLPGYFYGWCLANGLVPWMDGWVIRVSCLILVYSHLVDEGIDCIYVQCDCMKP